MTEKQRIEKNIKAACILMCKMTMESLDATGSISGDYLKNNTATAMKRLSKIVDILKAELRMTSQSEDADQMVDDTERIVYLIAGLDDKQRKSVVGLITKITKS